MFQGFDAVYDNNSKILILGSFPSVKSREYGFYYGNKQNRFWKMLSQIFDEKIADSIQNKKDFLQKHHIALYDVVQQSNLHGSADATLEKAEKQLADISFLLPPHTKVEKILCNGKTAFNLLTQNGSVCSIQDIPIFCLTSTSSANPRFNLAAWQQHLIQNKKD